MDTPSTIQTPVTTPGVSMGRGDPERAERPAQNGWLHPRFVACLLLMIASIAAMYLIPLMQNLAPRKLPLPLRKPLYLLDKAKLAPEYDLHPSQPDPFSHEMLETLGTDEYLNWNVISKRSERSSPTYIANVVVTYYTGQPDMVPHIPQDCMGASGWTLERETRAPLHIRGVGAPDDTIEAAVCEFSPPGGARDRNIRRTVLYFFYTNGAYKNDRLGVRLAQSSLSDKYAFYSKIELTFMDDTGRRMASRDETVEAAEPLLQKLLPALLASHYQNWADIKNDKPPVVGQ